MLRLLANLVFLFKSRTSLAFKVKIDVFGCQHPLDHLLSCLSNFYFHKWIRVPILSSNTSRVRLRTLISLEVSLFSELSINSLLFLRHSFCFCIRAIELGAYVDCLIVTDVVFQLKGI